MVALSLVATKILLVGLTPISGGTTSDTSHSLYVGSYGRNTAIQGFSDLDMIFQLPYLIYERYNRYSKNGQVRTTSNW